MNDPARRRFLDDVIAQCFGRPSHASSLAELLVLAENACEELEW